MTEDRGQNTEDRSQKSEDRSQKSEVRGLITDDELWRLDTILLSRWLKIR